MAAINRRQFMRVTFGAGLFPALPRFFAPENIIQAPPSVMLHSRHWRVLPDLLLNLQAAGYIGVTYRDWKQALIGTVALPSQPVILSVDDLSLAAGNTAFQYFRRMKDNCLAAGYKAVFSVITRPDVPQDDEHWNEVTSWISEGMELATHTAYHSNLDNPQFTPDDYDAEIVDSAAMIEARTQQPVCTLVTPFGSGYDVANHALNPNVLKAARDANLRFIAGISTGQRHVHVDVQAGDVIYAGRANPSDEHTVNDTLYYFKYW